MNHKDAILGELYYAANIDFANKPEIKRGYLTKLQITKGGISVTLEDAATNHIISISITCIFPTLEGAKAYLVTQLKERINNVMRIKEVKL